MSPLRKLTRAQVRAQQGDMKVRKMTITERLEALKSQMCNHSPKLAKRLRASRAAIEYANLIKSLPGSARRALARGKQI